jgi:ferredoxin, 2Fe-2S
LVSVAIGILPSSSEVSDDGENPAKMQAGEAPAFDRFLCPDAADNLNCYLTPMAKLRIQFENGDPEKVIEFDPAKAPFHHDGKPGSILDVMLGHGIHLEHACGGNCACTTCHVIVKNGFNKLGESTEQEEDLLDRAPGLTATSRLGCQAVIEDPNAEIVVVIPRYTINQVSEE